MTPAYRMTFYTRGMSELLMERADRARDLSDKRDTRVSSEIIRSSLFGMRYLSDKRDTRVSYITR